MKRLDLERHLRSHGCSLAREGGNHAIWKNPATGKVAPVPRHREIKEGTVRAVCRSLKFPDHDRPSIPLNARSVYWSIT